MKISKLQNSSIRRVATILGAAALLMTAAGPVAVQAAPLSTTQRAQASELAAKLETLAKSLGPNATEGAFEGAFADAVTGYDTSVIEAALKEIAGDGGLPPKAQAAAQRLDRVYASNDGQGGGTGAVGGFGGTPGGFGGPGFSGGGGGGGSNYGH